MHRLKSTGLFAGRLLCLGGNEATPIPLKRLWRVGDLRSTVRPMPLRGRPWQCCTPRGSLRLARFQTRSVRPATGRLSLKVGDEPGVQPQFLLGLALPLVDKSPA